MVDKKDKDQNTEQRILEAAKAVFLERGLDGARMQDIADKAGINKALLHYYFRSKDRLFDVIFREAAARFLPKLGELFASEMPLFEKIEKFVHFYIDMLQQNPHLPLFVLNEMQKVDGDEFMKFIWEGKQPALKVMARQVEEEIKKGTIKPVKPFHLLLNIVSMSIFPFVARPIVKLVWEMDDPQFQALMEERKKVIVQFILDSIRK
ncbi:TetR/AcrR family transcriptional regulator [Pseudoflavitalea rhizosphaerae]|uniref:TetR/AcrR family transcriptional regulator n=1 Tax=Pseudoflavitalea rhizosphaerae TaxID=1884793 RepID=UPI000F8D931F|nr:TetR/AcrR family transcriptional regulator [Pseudoflavitalea rhizosphaerae]